MPHRTPAVRAARWTTSALTGLAVMAGLMVGSSNSAAAAVDVALDGSTQARAAVSCWEIKQIKPSATDGRYWLLTPQLKAPTQFYCDMTTDGGGWVLIGRGREGWKPTYNGRGTPEQVSSTVTGTAAFNTRQLDANVVDALLGGNRLDEVSPELRVRRARNEAGTQWQEVTMTFARAERWTWALDAGVPLSRVEINGQRVATQTTTRDISPNDGWNRLWTYRTDYNNWVRGLNYGTGARGSDSAGTYLYSEASNGGAPTPFAQMFLRPKLRKADVTFSTIANAGTATDTMAAVPNNGAEPQTWGVTGLGAGGSSENATEVQALEQIGNSMFAGGNFTRVQRGANAGGSDVVNQSYLAAFDVATGNYKSTFQPPTLNNQVKALAELPGNRLAVGGEFTTVNGQSRPGFVVLNATTGAVDTTWTASILNKLTGGVPSIRGLDVSGDYLYFGGAMTHFKTPSGEVYAKGSGRIRISTRAPDSNWNPEFNGTVTALDVSADGTRVYYAGYFTRSGTAIADRAAAFSTASGAPRIAPVWQPTFSTNGSSKYQQAVKEAGSKVWLGGSQHSMFSYDRDTFALEDRHVTKAGGDLQAIDEGGGVVYGGCHCEHFNYSDQTMFDGLNPGQYATSWRFADAIYYVGAWSASTGDYLPDFSPEMRARNGLGAWALEVATDGTVWAGGSFETAVNTSGSNQWNGGFVRFAQRDTAAPARPTNLTAAVTGTDAAVTWSGSSGASAYEVLRNDRVVATVDGTSATIPDSQAGDRFFVRARDERGNRSASTAQVVATAAAQTTTLLAPGSSWSYRFDDSATPVQWAAPTFDDASWSNGTAPLGFGSADNATDIDVPAGTRRAVVSYYRNTFTIPAGMRVGDVDVTTWADDGVAVFVNGTEIGRSNLNAGEISDSLYAASAPRTAAAKAAPVTFTIPRALLQQGENTIAISSHSMWRATPDSSMDATVVAEEGTFTPPAPSTETTLVAERATWRYLFSATTTPPATWTTSSSGIGSWGTGQAPLGWGDSSIRTNIDVPEGQTRGLTSYYRRGFTVDDPDAFDTVTLTTRADDGAAIYVNGTEVGRTRLPAGQLTPGTYATTAVSTSSAVANPVVIDIPTSLLEPGTNVVAVEVHSNYRSTGNHSMALTMVGRS